MKPRNHNFFAIVLLTFWLASCSSTPKDDSTAKAEFARSMREADYRIAEDKRRKFELDAKEEARQKEAVERARVDIEKRVATGLARYKELSAEMDEKSKRDAAEYEAHVADIRKRPIRLGMTAKQIVEKSYWGSPDSINTTINSNGKSEQWVYKKYGYLYLQNGKLTTIQLQE